MGVVGLVGSYRLPMTRFRLPQLVPRSCYQTLFPSHRLRVPLGAKTDRKRDGGDAVHRAACHAPAAISQ